MPLAQPPPSGWFRDLLGEFRRADEREFLPAALEVIETPPSPVGRGVAFIIIAFFIIAVLWAVVGRVDILATAQGRIAPAGQIKIIQPADTGVVRAIHVEDGQQVKAGDDLVDLDPTQPDADKDRLAADLMHARLDIARLTALKTAFERHSAPVFETPPGSTSADLVDQSRAAMLAQYDQQVAKQADLTQQIAEKHAEAAEMQAQISKINGSLPMLSEKQRIHQSLTDQGYGSNLAYLDAQQQLSEAKHDLSVQSERSAQASSAQGALERQLEGARSTYLSGVLDDLAKAQERESEASDDLIKATNKAAEAQLKAPISGFVEQLAIHTARGVVTPAQNLMIIVPENQRLMVDARLDDRDVGFVHAGQKVKVKIDTFNFTRYGVVDGYVENVSRDAIERVEREQPTAGETGGAPQQSGPAYFARIVLTQSSMLVDGRQTGLEPGMAVTAEIRTGSRSIIDYLLSPLSRKMDESLHER